MSLDYVVVLVTHNRIELLRECLEHIEKQTIKARTVIIVDNASIDGTAEYLKETAGKNPSYQVISCGENLGGAGGFEKGIAQAAEESVDCVLMIDDDALIDYDYMERILAARQGNGDYKAFAGTVECKGVIDTFHRRNKAKYGLRLKNCPESAYERETFECDIASFCGMVVDREIIKKAGLPKGEYFIWCDDIEYSLRINRYTKFLVVTKARLNHKTKDSERKYPHRRYDWREYYGIRNRLLYVKKHGNMLDRAINKVDMFCRIVFRNWLFGLIKMDGYDWEYEKETVRKAFKDAKRMKG